MSVANTFFVLAATLVCISGDYVIRDSAKLQISCETDENADQVWFKDGQRIMQDGRRRIQTDGRRVTLTINPTRMGDAGTYVCSTGAGTKNYPVKIVRGSDDAPLYSEGHGSDYVPPYRGDRGEMMMASAARSSSSVGFFLLALCLCAFLIM